MAKLIHANRPELKAAWEAYGHLVAFEKLDGIKIRADGCYCVVRWTEGKMVCGADLTRTGPDAPWDMQNDECGPWTEKQWNKLRIVPDCDWFEIAGEEGEEE